MKMDARLELRLQNAALSLPAYHGSFDFKIKHSITVS